MPVSIRSRQHDQGRQRSRSYVRTGLAIVGLTLASAVVVQSLQLDHYRQAIIDSQIVFQGASAVELDRRFGPAGWSSLDLGLISHYT
jgi:hypothetical protein